MKWARDIGEFKARYFVIATVLFLVFGLVLYCRLDFYVDPSVTNDVTKQQEDLGNLKRRIENLEKANDSYKVELTKKEKEIKDCGKSHGQKKK